MKDRGGDLEREHFFRKIERRRREATKVFGGKKAKEKWENITDCFEERKRKWKVEKAEMGVTIGK